MRRACALLLALSLAAPARAAAVTPGEAQTIAVGAVAAALDVGFLVYGAAMAARRRVPAPAVAAIELTVAVLELAVGLSGASCVVTNDVGCGYQTGYRSMDLDAPVFVLMALAALPLAAHAWWALGHADRGRVALVPTVRGVAVVGAF